MANERTNEIAKAGTASAQTHGAWESAAQDAWDASKAVSDDSRTRIVSRIQHFSGQPFTLIDFDQTGFISKSELQEGIDNAYLTGQDAAFGNVLLKNFGTIGNGYDSLGRENLSVLSDALDPEGKVPGHQIVTEHPEWKRLLGSAGMGIPGCVFGALIGGPFITPLGGCAVGASITSGGSYLFFRKSDHDEERATRSLASQALKNTLKQLDEASKIK